MSLRLVPSCSWLLDSSGKTEGSSYHWWYSLHHSEQILDATEKLTVEMWTALNVSSLCRAIALSPLIGTDRTHYERRQRRKSTVATSSTPFGSFSGFYLGTEKISTEQSQTSADAYAQLPNLKRRKKIIVVLLDYYPTQYSHYSQYIACIHPPWQIRRP
jgi:hypothetical protein